MGTPEWILIGMTVVGLLITAMFHGRPQAPYNIFLSMVGTAITYGLLYWGGFFR
jgi:hypothetical protein